MINTAIFLVTKITTQKFEHELYIEFLELINNLPIKYNDWANKIQSLHRNWMSNRLNINYKMNKQERIWLEKKMKRGNIQIRKKKEKKLTCLLGK